MSVKNQDWHAEQIKAAVRMKEGKSLAQLSREAGLKPDTMRNVFRCHIPRYEAIIAGYLGTEPAAIWPSRYL
ncbi:helix-turn-helix domain-containing protein [Kluyvera cryocrescens]|uniref:helix-turn-helix domain-containing protein n=1 Tax=Kluyvera TaxID=579 RepID=UPI0028048006|nr:helix-turn-helix domain-containing protein [Kluyvera ascorbata]MDU3910679.1 helix-turn-helix domain-containing protein [Kluyvera ascorbata]HBL0734299.1 helix-turn-helix domain-containing protein [Kluyvera ascorbata]HDG1721782.1 helix-turn-helix domain-containing protein [Kluyvera ascorbata]